MWPGALADPDVVQFAAWISVWVRWFIWLVGVFELAHRSAFWYPQDIEFLLRHALLPCGRNASRLSQTIHDTTAQTAYMIGLGIHRARNLADESNQELKAALDAILELATSAMWEASGRDVAGVARAGGVGVRGRREQASAMDRGAPGLVVKPLDVVKPVAYHGLRRAMAESD